MTTNTLTPSLTKTVSLSVVSLGAEVVADALAVPITSDGEVPEILGVDLPALSRAGFTPEVGKAIAFPTNLTPTLVAVGAGEPASLGTAALRDADTAIVKGILLARYQFSLRSEQTGPVAVHAIVFVAKEGTAEEVSAGAARGLATARAARLDNLSCRHADRESVCGRCRRDCGRNWPSGRGV